MKKHFISLIIACLFAACTPKEKRIPKDIMPIDKMKIIVWDLTQAGAYADYLNQKDTTKKNISTVYFAEALKLHNISKEDFFKSFNFYQAHPVLNKILFDSINAYSQRQRNEIYKRNR